MKSFRVKIVLHFKDGINPGAITVKAINEAEAIEAAKEKMQSIWNQTGSLKEIEIVSVKKQ